MLQRQNTDKRHSMMAVTLDELVPQDHLVRKIDVAIDFSFIYDLVKDLYSENKGRPSIDPVVLIKIPLISTYLGFTPCDKPSKKLKPTWRIVVFWDSTSVLVDVFRLTSIRANSVEGVETALDGILLAYTLVSLELVE